VIDPHQDSTHTVDPIATAHPPATPLRESDAKRSSTGLRYASQVLRTSAPLVAADLLALMVSALLAFALVRWFWPGFQPDLAYLLPLLCGAFLIIYALFGLYPGTGLNPVAELRQTNIATTLFFTAFFTTSFAFEGSSAFTSWLVSAWFLTTLIDPALRSATRSLFSRFRWWGQPVLIFGGRTAATTNYRHFTLHPRLGFRPIGIIDDSNLNWSADVPELPAYLGPPEKAAAIANEHRVFWAIVAMPERPPSEVQRLIKSHAQCFPHLLVVPDMDGLPSLWNRPYDCGGLVGIHLEINLLLPLPQLLKRMVDLAIVIVGGLCALPLIAVIALLIKFSSPGPVIYGHERIGRNGRRLRVWKFRTMIAHADKVLEPYLAANPKMRKEWDRKHKLANDPRLTRIGRWLRKTSLDELPQLWNVLIGEMSLVGPRPIVEAEVVRYGESFDLYTKVLPGITGLWQISGRNNITYAERVHLDSYYVRNWSPWMDLYILARTFRVVLQGEGAY
jgi:Undecaprenyl-phosphate galactose phosphotransferase WbaP